MKPNSIIIIFIGLALALGLGASWLLPKPASSSQIEWLTTTRPITMLPTMPQSQRWKLVALGYTRCPDVCPTTLGAMATLSQVSDKPLDYVFVSVDGVAGSIVSQYASAFDRCIRGVTGTVAQISDFVADAGALYEVPDSLSEPVAHSTFLILIDPSGLMRGRVRMGFDIELLAQELNYLPRYD
jgi:cytochrome oxidase Cu insertion factor (SCO1/SenC/PrrC family)